MEPARVALDGTEPEPAEGGDGATRDHPSGPAPSSDLGSTAAIIGRSRELAAVAAFAHADASHGGLVLSGDPGIGKTTLWQATAALARAGGLRVLSARPAETETRLSYATLTDLLDGVADEALPALPAPQRRALQVALLRADVPDTPPEPRAIAVGLLNALRALAAREPLMVAIDDVHWLDASSAEALTFAARRLGDEPIRFLLARRPGTVSPLERALADRGLMHLDVGPLSAGATRRILYDRLGLVLPRRVLRRVFEAAHGNALFALELGRTLVGRDPAKLDDDVRVPDEVEDLLGTRIAGLPASVRRVLLAVALSADLRPSQLVEVAGPNAIAAAEEAGVLVIGTDRVRPSHPLLAAAAKAASADDERRELHRSLAGVVGEEERRVRHLALAASRPDTRLAARVAAAASGAAAHGRTEDAVELADEALRLTPATAACRAEHVLALGEYLLVAGEPQRVEDLLAPELARLPPGSARARAHLLLAHESRLPISHVSECETHLQRALAESTDDPALRATVMARIARYAAVVRVERIAEAEATALEALPAAEVAGQKVLHEVVRGLSWARSLRGQPLDDLVERYRPQPGDSAPLSRMLEWIAAEQLVSRGQLKPAERLMRRQLELAEERGEAWSSVRLRLGLCELHLRAGNWGEALRLLDEWAQSAERELLTAPASERCHALLALGRGEAPEAERWAVAAIAESEAKGLGWDRLEALRVRGVAALLGHQPALAAVSLRAVWDHTEREGVEEPGAFPVAPDLVEALAELGERDEAAAVTVRLRALAEAQSHPWALVSTARCAALVRLVSGTFDPEAAEQLAQAAAGYDALGLRFDGARTLLVLGRTARRHRKWGVARGWLEQATASFEALGSPGWAEQARSELARVGARRPSVSGSLTPAEGRVAELAASGRSNKEIAGELFVGVHTVEVHLSHVYAKLGIRSRTQLANRLVGRA